MNEFDWNRSNGMIVTKGDNPWKDVDQRFNECRVNGCWFYGDMKCIDIHKVADSYATSAGAKASDDNAQTTNIMQSIESNDDYPQDTKLDFDNPPADRCSLRRSPRCKTSPTKQARNVFQAPVIKPRPNTEGDKHASEVSTPKRAKPSTDALTNAPSKSRSLKKLDPALLGEEYEDTASPTKALSQRRDERPLQYDADFADEPYDDDDLGRQASRQLFGDLGKNKKTSLIMDEVHRLEPKDLEFSKSIPQVPRKLVGAAQSVDVATSKPILGLPDDKTVQRKQQPMKNIAPAPDARTNTKRGRHERTPSTSSSDNQTDTSNTRASKRVRPDQADDSLLLRQVQSLSLYLNPLTPAQQDSVMARILSEPCLAIRGGVEMMDFMSDRQNAHFARAYLQVMGSEMRAEWSRNRCKDVLRKKGWGKQKLGVLWLVPEEDEEVHEKELIGGEGGEEGDWDGEVGDLFEAGDEKAEEGEVDEE